MRTLTSKVKIPMFYHLATASRHTGTPTRAANTSILVYYARRHPGIRSLAARDMTSLKKGGGRQVSMRLVWP